MTRHDPPLDRTDALGIATVVALILADVILLAVAVMAVRLAVAVWA